jgi:transposase
LEAYRKKLKEVSRRVFDCQNDAKNHIEAMIKKQKKFEISFRIEQIKRFAKKGRPSKKQEPISVGYQLIAEAKIKQEFYNQALLTKGRFILATNEMNPSSLSSHEILKEYKNQQSPERGFRFLKDPYFIAGEVYLKKPERLVIINIGFYYE